jgi:hypothetical protein
MLPQAARVLYCAGYVCCKKNPMVEGKLCLRGRMLTKDDGKMEEETKVEIYRAGLPFATSYTPLISITAVDANSESTYIVLFRIDWGLFISWR